MKRLLLETVAHEFESILGKKERPLFFTPIHPPSRLSSALYKPTASPFNHETISAAAFS
jgi:hypothetical protein